MCTFECEDPRCEICDAEDVCQSCDPGLYLYKGVCLDERPKPKDENTARIKDDD